MPIALLALAIGAFGIGTTEFVIMGLLPQVAVEYGVSIPTAGYLASGYAVGVLVGAPLMTILGTRVSRKTMLMALMGIFVAGNLLSAVAPAFGLMLAGRIVTSLAHGAFFGIGSVVAANLVAPQKRASAIALMFTGLTLANVVGVPLGTLLGQQTSWRLTFAAVAVLGVLAVIGVALLIPADEAPSAANKHIQGERGLVLRELAAFRDVQVLLAMAMTVLGFGGVFAAITYIAPMMTEAAGFAESGVTWILVLLGIGMVIGNLVGGRLADRALMPLLYVSLAAVAAVLALFAFAAYSQIASAVAVVLIGLLGFATVPPLQKRVLDLASGAPTLASAVNVGAFNLGNALAAWLGGLVISGGFGITAPNVVGALMAGSALGLAVISGLLERRRAQRPISTAASVTTAGTV
ncbi:MFS transporter [Nonomuraea mangrovi]|uniref:MFS transporter n=1 Tax=Nonomuraea mangrovi TaxID=2316207 RepID=A0ABW4T5Q2_9ACTN